MAQAKLTRLCRLTDTALDCYEHDDPNGALDAVTQATPEMAGAASILNALVKLGRLTPHRSNRRWHADTFNGPAGGFEPPGQSG
ncbi:hypothetical protein [Streptacidiphilus anmyonensis]|uniref:hypothetical protein n=1 Tax=Streptacidiphilus anmyonensis TaxID=405782 RepID=UPI000A83B35E|nr:hypothetical protein [Streptacidiphilus anmyonensis]